MNGYIKNQVDRALTNLLQNHPMPQLVRMGWVHSPSDEHTLPTLSIGLDLAPDVSRHDAYMTAQMIIQSLILSLNGNMPHTTIYNRAGAGGFLGTYSGIDHPFGADARYLNQPHGVTGVFIRHDADTPDTKTTRGAQVEIHHHPESTITQSALETRLILRDTCERFGYTPDQVQVSHVYPTTPSHESA